MVRRLEAVFAKGIKVRAPSVEDVLVTPFDVDSNLWEVKREMRQTAMVRSFFSHAFGTLHRRTGLQIWVRSLGMKQTRTGCAPELYYYIEGGPGAGRQRSTTFLGANLIRAAIHFFPPAVLPCRSGSRRERFNVKYCFSLT